jgi:hypothetical protein
MKPRIRSSVGVVINEGSVEFFKGNTRRSIMMKLNENVAHLICELDGSRTIEEICADYQMDKDAKKKFRVFIKVS